MKTAQITLRALEPNDLDFLYELENDQSLWQISDTLVPFSKYVLKEYIDQALQDIFTTKQQRFVISNSEQQALGIIDLYDFDPVHHRAGVGVVIHHHHQRKGIATKALALLEKQAFKHLQLNQLYATAASDNIPSIALFKECGYTQIGIAKDWYFFNDHYHDAVLFQKLKNV